MKVVCLAIKSIKQPLIGWIVWRIKKNKNFIGVINCSTGSGKSYAGLKLCLDISKILGSNFTVKDNVDFSFIGLLKKTKLPQNTKAGTCFLFEEVGAMGGGGAGREWQSKANKFFTSFLQTTRHKRQILIFTFPQFNFLDSIARALVHMQMIMQGIDFKKKVSYLKPYLIQTNDRTGKMYFKLLRFTIEGVRHKLTSQRMGLPPEDMIKEYEKMKVAFTDKLDNEIIDDEMKQQEKEKKKKQRRDRLLNAEIISPMFKEGKTNKEIARITGKSVEAIKYWKRKLGLTKKNSVNEQIEGKLLRKGCFGVG